MQGYLGQPNSATGYLCLLPLWTWYSSHAAQWGTAMIGLETGEKIIAMQAQIAFLRGAARQNDKPFYVQPCSGLVEPFPFFKKEKTNIHLINWMKPQSSLELPKVELLSLMVGILPHYSHECGTLVGCQGRR